MCQYLNDDSFSILKSTIPYKVYFFNLNAMPYSTTQIRLRPGVPQRVLNLIAKKVCSGYLDVENDDYLFIFASVKVFSLVLGLDSESESGSREAEKRSKSPIQHVSVLVCKSGCVRIEDRVWVGACIGV